jgi:hypothetical protein
MLKMKILYLINYNDKHFILCKPFKNVFFQRGNMFKICIMKKYHLQR